eukprot:Pgem_evm1s883
MKFICGAGLLLLTITNNCLASVRLKTQQLETNDNYNKNNNEKENVLSVTLKDVTNLADYAKTHDINVMVIKDLSQEYEDALNNMKKDGPECLKTFTNLPVHISDDGGERRTYPYDQDTTGPECIPSMKTIEYEFDLIHNNLVKGLEKVVGNSEKLEWITGQGEKTNLQKTTFKSHIHVYENKASFEHGVQADGSTVPLHTDTGLYLLLTPSEIGLVVQNNNGVKVDLSGIPNNSVIMLMGSAMSDWLLQEHKDLGEKLNAVPHAVPAMPAGVQYRTVFARMRTADSEAIPVIQGSKNNVKTFKDIFLKDVHDNKNHHSRFARASATECTDPNESMCWNQCMSIPPACNGASDLQCSKPTDSAISNTTRTYCRYVEGQPAGFPHGMTCEMTCAAAEGNGKTNLTMNVSPPPAPYSPDSTPSSTSAVPSTTITTTTTGATTSMGYVVFVRFELVFAFYVICQYLL